MSRLLLLAAVLLWLAACANPAPPPAEVTPAAEPARPVVSEESRAEAEALYAEAAELARAQRFELARPKLERAVRIDPNHADAHVMLAEAYWRAGRWDDAVREAEHGRDADPENFRPWLALAGYYRGLGRDAESEAAARRWIALGPPDPAPWKTLADLGYDGRNYALCVEGAEGAIQVVESNPPEAAPEAAKVIYEEMRLYRAVCREAIRIGAAGAAAPAAARDPASELRERRARKHLLEADRLIQQRRPAAAILQLDQALAAQPDDAEILLRLADARWRARKREAAVEAAERARELEPTSTAAISALAVYQRELERWADSEANHRRFAELAPGDPWPWGGLGLLGYQSGNWKLCVESYDRFVGELGRLDARLFSEQREQARAEAVDLLKKCRAKKR
jgi:tetratricopeptide (TPR) repeat protein